MKNTIRQQDIADHLGLDQRTVSQALAGKPGIAAVTRERVMAAARELGYRPNFSAQAIRSGTQKRLGLLTSTNASLSALPPDRLRGMQSAARAAGYGLSLVSLPDEEINDPHQMALFLGSFGVDGVLLNYGRDRAEDKLTVWDRFNLPTVAINSLLPEDCVYPDDRGLAAEAVEHLAAHGYRRFLYIPYGPRRLHSGQYAPPHFSEDERRQGLQGAATRLGLPAEVIACADFSADTARKLCAGANPAQTAVICYNESCGLRVKDAFLEAGLRTPEAALLCQFHWRPYYDDALDGRLRTILMPEFKIGLNAVNMLLAKLRTAKAQPAQAVGFRRGVLEYLTADLSYSECPAGLEPQDE